MAVGKSPWPEQNAPVIVAASNSAGAGKSRADYVCPATGAETVIRRALLDAHTQGRGVLFLNGAYTLTPGESITLEWTASPDPGWGSVPQVSYIEGEGYNTVINGQPLSGRGVLELLGESNTYAVNMPVRNLRIRSNGGSSSGWGLRVGDARDFLAERVWVDAANGIRLKIASSASYAQINTVFRQCSVHSNYNLFHYADDANAEVWALGTESGGALCDNVRFESCFFAGLVEPRAAIAEFQNCQFASNPYRPVTSRNFNASVFINAGSATFRSCYCEDAKSNLALGAGVAGVSVVTIDDCHFSGVHNYGGAATVDRAVLVRSLNAAWKTGHIAVRRSRFGSGFALEPLRFGTGVLSAAVENNTIIGAPSSRPAIADRHSGVVERWTGSAQVGSVVETFGTGSPEGVVTGAVGSRYWRTDGGTSTTMYVKESGTGNTGWVAK